MLKYAKASDKSEFIIGTEQEMLYRLKKEIPDKRFYSVPGAICPTMKLITLDNVLRALETLSPEVEIPPEIMQKARAPLDKMVEMGRGD
jgi:quinolinate synthase